MSTEPELAAGTDETGRGHPPARVLDLNDPAAADPAVAGAKAAALARAAGAGLPVLAGVVVSAPTARSLAGGDRPDGLDKALRAAWEQVSARGSRPVVVRSSATVEDSDAASMAGLFRSILGVDTFERFVAAVHDVAASAASLPGFAREAGEQGSVAVLVQPHLVAAFGGVMFGADPVSGDRDVLVVGVGATPDDVVRGVGLERQYRLRPTTGSVVSSEGGPGSPSIGWRHRLRLARLARATERAFGKPQDVEWAVDRSGHLWLLQSRPITTSLSRVDDLSRVEGPLFGVGPVAETFPQALAPLEEDLWLDPLRHGLGQAVVLSGAASRRRVQRSEVVVSIDGQVAVDLDLLGVAPRNRLLARLSPLGPARRMAAAWRVGRLHHALPALARELLAAADADLSGLPPLSALSDDDLLRLLRRSKPALASLHAYEVLGGLFVRQTGGAPTAAGEALLAVAAGHRAGLADQEILERNPAALTLSPPRIGGRPTLPETDGLHLAHPVHEAGPGGRVAVLREALRLRARWVQELSGRSAWELGLRLAQRRELVGAEQVRRLHLDELEELVLTGRCAIVVGGEVGRDLPEDGTPPLPATFRRHPGAGVVAVNTGGGPRGRARIRPGDGIGAGGGTGTGPVHHVRHVRHGLDGPPPAGAVLVVRSLDPALAGHLPVLAGLVAETGTALSHLAILAREQGVPTVVGVEGALGRFPPGVVATVDGSTGRVTVDHPQGRPAEGTAQSVPGTEVTGTDAPGRPHSPPHGPVADGTHPEEDQA